LKNRLIKIQLLITLLCLAFFDSKAQIPANDNPCNATPLTVGTSCVYINSTNVNATASAGVPAPGCANYSGADVWFSAVVPASGIIVFDSNIGTMINGAMAAYSGSCGSLTLINCNNNGSTNGLMPALTIAGQAPGSTIWIRFWSPGSNNNGTFSICASTIAPCNPANINSSCTSADPFCAGATTNLCNTTNVPSLGGGGIYGCLGSAPNPAFYFLNIATSGPIDLLISQQTINGVGIDVDFVMWGPFASQAAMCAGLSAGTIVDCSFSFAATEVANIPNAVAGQWYMFLITNYSNLNGVIQIDQTNAGNTGAGATNCNLLTASPGACTAGTFTLNGTVQTSTIPTSGTLTVSTSCGGSVVYNAPFNFTNNYSIPGLPACGQNCSVSAVFSEVGAPAIISNNFTATNCNVLTASAGACVSGQYVLSGTITAGCLPSTGTLTVTSSCGGSVTLNPPFTNPINWSLPASSGNGGNCTVTAVFSASGSPIINPITIVEPSCCGANVGTYNVSFTGGTSSVLSNGIQQIILCPGGSVTINTNNNFTLPPPGCGICVPGMMFGIYSSGGPTGPDPDVDPNWTGYYWTGSSFPGTNTDGLNINTSGGCSPLFGLPSDPAYASMNPTNNTFVYVPITADASNLPTHDNNFDGCFNIGLGYSVTYLNPINFNAINSCSGTMKIEISGGYPEFFTGVYNLTNTGAGTLSATSISSGGSVIVSGLTSGQTVSFSVTDLNGCSSTFSKVYTNSPLPTVNLIPATTGICAGNCTVLTATVTPNVNAGTTTFSNTNCTVIPDGGIGGGNNGNLNNGVWAMSPINISDYCGLNWTTGQTLQVCINIAHTFDADLNVFLQAPNGVLLSLTSDDGNGGNNFTNTCFSTANANVIGTGGNNNAPFSGSYAPDGAGGFNVFNGTPVNGVWKLWLADDLDFESGNLLNWSITFTNQSSYTFSWDPTTSLSSTTVLNPTACPTSTTTYTVTAINSCGCSASASSTITVSPVPTATISGTTTICSGSGTNIIFAGSPDATITYTINSGANQTILLDGSGNAILPTGNLFSNTTYALVNVALPGCTQTITGSAIISVNPLPVATFTYPTPVCKNAANPLPTYTGAGVAGVFSSSPAGLNFVNTSTGEINLATTLPNTYTITNTIAAAGGCPTVTATFSIVINTVSALSITPIPGSATTCFGVSNVILTASPNNLLNYSWSPALGLSGTNVFSVVAFPSSATTYTVVGTESNGCTTSASVLVNVSIPSNAGTNANITICSNGSNVDLFNSLGGTPQATGTWSGPSVLTGGNLGTFTTGINVAGTYTYTVAGTAPCPIATANVIVTVNDPPFTGITYPGSPFCSNYIGSVNPVITGITGGTFSSNPIGLSINGAGVITPGTSSPGTYTVTYQVPNSGGCSAYNVTQTVVIQALPVLPTLLPNPPCSGVPVNFVAGGGSLYEFILNGVSQGAPNNSSNITLGPLNVGDQVCVNSYPPLPINFNGLITEAEWGNPLSTSSGGPAASGFGVGNNLDALYLKNSSGYFYGALAGNVVNGSNNRLLLFIDCQPGGFNNLGAWVARNNAPYVSVENLNNINFDAGFTPEYILAMNQAAADSYFDLYNMANNTNNFLGTGSGSANLGFVGNIGIGDFSKGFEFAIPMANLGNPTVSIKVFAMLVNDPGFGVTPTTISNQFLTPCGPAEINYGNGVINFAAALPNPIQYALSADCFSQTCVTVVNTIVPTFSFPLSLCSGALAPTLPLVSDNGISGTWSPSSINNTVGNSYTFTPSSGCASPVTINVTITANPALSPLFHD
jgi:subtilisin-like proprotein convertase family protein